MYVSDATKGFITDTGAMGITRCVPEKTKFSVLYVMFHLAAEIHWLDTPKRIIRTSFIHVFTMKRYTHTSLV
jgi:hypothetical protein